MKDTKRINVFSGISSVGDVKDIPDTACYDQQDVVSSPLTTLSTRDGYTKFSTAVLSGTVISMYGYVDRVGTVHVVQHTSTGKIIVGTSE